MLSNSNTHSLQKDLVYKRLIRLLSPKDIEILDSKLMTWNQLKISTFQGDSKIKEKTIKKNEFFEGKCPLC